MRMPARAWAGRVWAGRADCWSTLRLHHATLVALRGHLLALVAIDREAADVGHENARLPWHVGAEVPAVGQRIDRAFGHLVDVRHPLILRRGGGLDAACL